LRRIKLTGYAGALHGILTDANVRKHGSPVNSYLQRKQTLKACLGYKSLYQNQNMNLLNQQSCYQRNLYQKQNLTLHNQ
jgi:hypothetical protein